MSSGKDIDGSILIAGAGALGLVIGGMLKAAGHPVTLLGRARHLDAIAERGLTIDRLFGRHQVGGFECVRDAGQVGSRRFPIILVAVKSYDTAQVAPNLAGMLATGGLVVCMQNGLGNIEVVAAHVGAENIMGARVIFGAEIEQPGWVRVTVIAEPVALGPAPDLSGTASAALIDRGRRLAAELCAAGVPSQAVDDIRPLLWTKLFYNAALNPLGALLKLNYGAIGADPQLRRIMDSIVDEAFAVARKRGVRIPYQSAAEYLAVFYGKLLPATREHRPSMLADLEHRGRTEIGALNGRIVEMAAAAGLDAPANRIITALIRARERTWRPLTQEDR
jgi:2-dehydropantoate 2-reductase